MKQADWKRLYTRLNDEGAGCAPESDSETGDVDYVVAEYVRDGWTLVCERTTRDDVDVLRHPTADLYLVIAGDRDGVDAWAVEVLASDLFVEVES